MSVDMLTQKVVQTLDMVTHTEALYREGTTDVDTSKQPYVVYDR